MYQDGTLQKHLHDFFVTDEVRELANGEDVEVNVTIDEGEYQKACLELMNGAQGIVCAQLVSCSCRLLFSVSLNVFSVQSMDE